MNVYKITPRGYCHGVVSALQIVAKTMRDENTLKPIYILGEIVHNQIITKAFADNGVITLTGDTRENLLNQIDSGTVIITAHGIDHNVIDKAINKGLNVVDATCSDVYRTHNLIKKKLEENYEVLYIGKKNHPEPEGVLGISKTKIHLISNKEDLDALNIDPNQKLMVTNQTTMSIWDTQDLISYAQKLYPAIEIHNEICLATQQRQEAIINTEENLDLIIVVGDKKSNNTNRLVQIAVNQAKTKAIRVEDLNDLPIDILLEDDIKNVGVTSGASTPTIITTQLIKFLERFDKNDKNTWEKDIDIDIKKIIPRARKEK